MPLSSASPNSSAAAPGGVTASEHADWFENEVRPHDAKLRSFLRSSFPSVRDVEDVVQESYLRIWRAKSSRPIASAKAFLFTVARRLALDLVRRERRSPIVAVEDIALVPTGEAAPGEIVRLDTPEHAALLVEAIESLAPRCRQIFVLCQVERLPQKAVAAQLGISESTVAVQSARGLQRCEEFVRARLARK